MTTGKLKKELRSWAVFVGILLTLYFTGLHTDVAAFAQRIVLATGIANPKTDKPISKTKATYDFTLDKLEGGTLDFETMRGKVVFINFWAMMPIVSPTLSTNYWPNSCPTLPTIPFNFCKR